MVNIANKMPPARALEAFVVAAESDSFEIAAGKLNRSNATFSLQIKSLEEHVGCQLLIRGKHLPTQLTDEGLAYYERARQALKLLAPDLPGVPHPIVTDFDDFDAILEESDPELREFWAKSCAHNHDLSSSKDIDIRYLRDRSLSFVPKQGSWCYNHIGRLTPFVESHGHAFAKKLIGTDASICRYSGAYNAYDYEVTKLYNKVGATRQPVIGDVEAHIQLPDDHVEHMKYRRLVIPATMDGEQVVVVRTIRLDLQPMLRMSDTSVISVDVEEAGRVTPQFSDLLSAWDQSRSLWAGQELQEFHDVLFLVRPLSGPVGALKMDHIGRNHGSVLLFGEQWRDLSSDEMFSDDDLGNEYNQRMEAGYRAVLASGEPQLDMICSKGLLSDGQLESLVYFRLLIRCVLSDGGLAVANMIHRARSLEDLEDPETGLSAFLSRTNP